MTTAMIYGATGYIGRLCAGEAAEAGLNPVLAGRDTREIAAMGEQLSLPSRVFGLDDSASAAAGLAGIDVVLNCAGPFHVTAPPLIRACVETGTHYLDLAGEVAEFQQCETYHAQAARAGVMLLPGAGFGVVPTDCLAVHVHRRMPDATHLELAFHTVGGLSRGTAATLLRDLAHQGVRRADGELIPSAPPPADSPSTSDRDRKPRSPTRGEPICSPQATRPEFPRSTPTRYFRARSPP